MAWGVGFVEMVEFKSATVPDGTSGCMGDRQVGIRVSDEMYRFLQEEAEMANVSKAEVIRRVLAFHRERWPEVKDEYEF